MAKTRFLPTLNIGSRAVNNFPRKSSKFHTAVCIYIPFFSPKILFFGGGVEGEEVSETEPVSTMKTSVWKGWNRKKSSYFLFFVWILFL